MVLNLAYMLLFFTDNFVKFFFGDAWLSFGQSWQFLDAFFILTQSLCRSCDVSLYQRNRVSKLVVLLQFLHQTWKSWVRWALRIILISINGLKLIKTIKRILHNFSFCIKGTAFLSITLRSGDFVKSSTEGISKIVFESYFLLIVPVLVRVGLWVMVMLGRIYLSEA